MELGDRGGISGCYKNIGIIYGMKKEFYRARDCWNKAYDLRKEMGRDTADLEELMVGLPEQCHP